jgi:myxalamid-type polyketide synthase MxaB
MNAHSSDENEPVAVIGLGCRFPGAEGPVAFWHLLERRIDAVGTLGAERARDRASAGEHDVRGGFLEHVDRFDARFFGISPREAERLDPQQRLLLEVTWEALEDAGLVVTRLDGSATGVFVGMWINDYEARMFTESGRTDFHMTTGSGRYTASGRLSHLLGLRGPSVTVDTACSSSLVAVHLACQSLWSGEATLAIAAGVNVILQPHITTAYSQAGMLSADGRCKFGDARADGYVRSEGVGVVVLKPLSHARRDRDPIHAVVLGSAVNNDGHTGGSLGTPGRAGQEDLLRSAYRRARVRPAAVGYVEAHGTGTRAGDPVELAALGAVLGEGRPAGRPCLVGSVKSNIGHTEGAAGIAGLIKVALCLEHRTIPPSLHCETPTSEVAWGELNLMIAGGVTRWPEGKRPLAGVSAFGIGGTNAHVVLAAHDTAVSSGAGLADDTETLLTVSARSAEALREQARRYSEYLAGPVCPPLGDVAFTAAVRRTHHEHRLAVVGRDRREIADRLDAYLGSGAAPGLVQARDAHRARVAFVFPGQGAQWLGMGRRLLETEPAFRGALERCDSAIAVFTGWSLLDELTAGERSRLDRIDVVQPALFGIQVALAELWGAWGVVPSAVVGHSMGEVAAAHIAGALPLDDAARIICVRSRLLRGISGRGAMAVVELSPDEAGARLRGREDRLSIAVCNSDRSTVIAGDVTDLEVLLGQLERDGVFCRRVKVDVASHSPQVDPLKDDLLRALEGIRPAPTRIPMYSTVTGEPIDGTRLDPGYWMRNLRETVQFSSAVRRLLADGCDAFVEISPHPVLLPAIEQTIPADRPAPCLPSMRRDESERAVMLESLGALHAHGYPVEWTRLQRAERCVSLPPYPWQRERFWYPIVAAGRRRPAVAGAHPLLDEHVVASTDPGTHYWQGTLDPERTPWLLEHRVQGVPVLPMSAMVEMVLRGADGVFGDQRCRVEDLRLESPLVTSEAGPSLVQLVVSAGLPGSASFRLASRGAGSEGADPWVVHAMGTFRTVEPAADASRSLPNLDPDGDMLSGERHYEAMRRRGLDYGPAFRGVDAVGRQGAGVVARLRATDPVREEHDLYAIHPALLDACFQGAVTALDGTTAPPSATYVPTAVDRFTLLRRPAGDEELWCRVSAGAFAEGEDVVADVEVVDRAGRLVVEATGVRLAPLARRAGPDLDRCLFEVVWQRATTVSSARESTGATWLILADRGGVAERLAARLAALGARYALVDPSDDGPAAVGAARAIESARPEEPIRGVIYLRGLDDAPLDGAARSAERIAEARAVRDLVDLVRAVVRREASEPPRLVVVTAGARDVAADEGRVRVEQAPLWGLGAVIATEHPELRCARVDLSAEPRAEEIEGLARECEATDGAEQVALRGRDRYVARLVAASFDCEEHRREESLGAAGDTPFRVRASSVATLDGLRLYALPRRPPTPGQVEIEVRAAGLNFRDVMSALGSLPGHPGGVGPIGMECAGRVVEVGAGVAGLGRGDEVVAIAFDCLGTHALADARLVVRKPAGLSHEIAATLPIAFATAWLALHRLAGLGSGDRVLIHAAAGGVGLAAVQIARRAGAEVFATAGSRPKHDYLHALGVEHVLDSRSLSFVKDVLALTRGAGVDIVLNSLAGEAIGAGLSILAPYGRFVEIGRRDIYRNAPMGLAPFRGNLSYSALDLERMCHERPEVLGALLEDLMRRVADGELEPLPVRVFPIAQVTDAFRYMAEARHIGKIALSLSPDDVRMAPVVPSPVGIRPDAAYLITGGLGALGLTMAGALVNSGARHVALVGRRPPGEVARGAIAELESKGARVLAIQTDVAGPEQVERALAEVRRRLPPLRGVIHAAGVLDDATLLQMTGEQIRAVMAPKAAGAWALHAATEGDPLDFFVMFSSASALLGLAGQANYAAANAFQDALARHRRQLGRPALSIGWGPWAEVGLAADRSDRGGRLEAMGLGSLTRGQGVEAFRRLLGDTRAYVAVMALDVEAWCGGQAGPANPLLDRLRTSGERGPVPGASAGGLLEALRAAPPAGRQARLLEHVRGRVARILRLDPSHVDRDAPLKSLGLDSLMTLELRNRLEADLGLRLSATLVWNYPTVSALAAHLAQALGLEAAAEAPATDRDLSSVPVATRLDEELERVSRLLATPPEAHGG